MQISSMYKLICRLTNLTLMSRFWLAMAVGRRKYRTQFTPDTLSTRSRMPLEQLTKKWLF